MPDEMAVIKEVPRLAIELSDDDVERLYQEYLNEWLGKVSKEQGAKHE
jgi:hypothetical protein